VDLQALDSFDAPSHVRLRIALKCLLRSFRLRCTAVTGLPHAAQDATGDDDVARQSSAGDGAAEGRVDVPE
jgi:hypothetical protein